jgi:hypothetical protein
MKKLTAPFPYELLASFNQYQHGFLHPLTCGNDRGDAAHREYASTHGGDYGALVATQKGWECPVCHYLQEWSPDVSDMNVRIRPPKVGDPFDLDWMAVNPLTGEWEPSHNGIRQIQKFFCIYDHPVDYPDYFLVRQWDIYEGILEPIPNEHRLANSLPEARELAVSALSGPGGVVRIDRDLIDDPYIVETWTQVEKWQVEKTDPVLICVRQEETWTWPEYLGEKTAGVCSICEAPIFFEKQNAAFKKICSHCSLKNA